MTVKEQIKEYIASIDEPKRGQMQELHKRIVKALPKAKLWFESGKDATGKIVSNPNIGYGSYTIEYANGTSREFFQIGLSANKAGISVYILGLADKTYLAKTYGKRIGKAKVTGYCISFKSVKDIDVDVLIEAINYRSTV